MTDHPTTPPPGPLPSTLPESERPPEMDTGKFHDEAALARVYVSACNARDEFEKWVRYLEGKLNGVEVDVAQSQAFEARTAQSFVRLDDKLDRVIGMLEKRETDLLEVHEKVVKLESWRIKHERGNAHCDDCPAAERATSEAQEA